MIVARIFDPRSQLATARGLDEDTSTSTLADWLGVQETDAQALYTAMDWLLERQLEIEKKLTQRHWEDGALVLYDVSSTYFEGECCPLGQRGHSRDGKKDKVQIVFGLLCNRAGCPLAVEVFEGNTADPKTLGSQIEKLRHRFKLSRIVLVGDRGMITEARLREEIQPIEGLDWITALRAPAIRPLVEAGKIQLSLFDERDLAEIQSPDYPGECLMVGRNPLMAARRAHQRQALLEATERELNQIVAATERSRRPLKGEAGIGLRVGKILNRFKMAKHFRLDIREASFSYVRDEVKIAEEAALDGIYVVRTSVQKAALDTEETVRAYKDLGHVEQAFRSVKTVDLKVRPIYHYLPERVRAHVFLCMLAYYVEWPIRQALATALVRR
jgi:transposase